MLPSPLKQHFIWNSKRTFCSSDLQHEYLKVAVFMITCQQYKKNHVFWSATQADKMWVSKVEFVWECMILINFQVNRSCWFSISQKLTEGSFYWLGFCSPLVCPVTGTLNLISSMSLVFRSNCDPVIRQELRTHYQLPYFLPKQSETSEQDWIFMGGPGPGAQIHVSLFLSLVTCICSNVQLWLCFLL